MSRFELTGKRNLHYNIRHRKYGRRCLMYDLDCMEVNQNGDVIALIETKYGLINNIDLNDHEFEVLFKLSQRLDLPLFCLVYYPFNKKGELLDADDDHNLFDSIQFYVVPVNEQAKKLVPKQCRMTEAQWLGLLYKLRQTETITPETEVGQSWKEVRLPFVFPRV